MRKEHRGYKFNSPERRALASRLALKTHGKLDEADYSADEKIRLDIAQALVEFFGTLAREKAAAEDLRVRPKDAAPAPWPNRWDVVIDFAECSQLPARVARRPSLSDYDNVAFAW